MKSSSTLIVGPAKTWQLLILLAFIPLPEDVASARPASQHRKSPTIGQKRTSKATAKQKAEFRRWLNDPEIGDIERTVRRELGWGVYGAMDLGEFELQNFVMGSGLQSYDPESDNIIIKEAVEQHQRRRPFLYRIKIYGHGDNIFQGYWIDGYRAIVGTRSGDVYEFNWRDEPSTKRMNFKLRKWKKPTVKRRRHELLPFDEVLFFDASQKKQ